jgi:hypothetical protein
MMPTILYVFVCNPDTRVKSDKTWNLEYYSDILCKTDHLSEKTSRKVHGDFIYVIKFFLRKDLSDL